MRLVGIIAVFVLTIAAIVEGAFLVRLSGQVAALSEQVRAQATADPLTPSRPHALAANPAARLPLPRLDTKPAAPEASGDGTGAPVPTAALGQALTTPEGLAHLKGAMSTLNEMERQARLAENAKEDVEREQRQTERLTRTLSLNSTEQGAIQNMYTSLQSARARVVEEMRAGIKTAEQADDEIDALEDKTETAVRSLLGEGRMKQMREARQAERMQRRLERSNQRGPAPGAPALAQPPN
jgi:hypothetical protein